MSDELEATLAPLMRAAQDGDGRAYQALLRGCLPVIIAIAARAGVPRDRRDDVVQDVLLTLHRARATFDPARPFLPWLRVIAQRRAVDALRRHGRGAAREVHNPLAYDGFADPAPAADAALDRQERQGALRGAVAALPPGQRQAVEHLALRGQSLDEAAAETGRNKGALKVNLHRAARALRSMLAPGGEDA